MWVDTLSPEPNQSRGDITFIVCELPQMNVAARKHTANKRWREVLKAKLDKGLTYNPPPPATTTFTPPPHRSGFH